MFLVRYLARCRMHYIGHSVCPVSGSHAVVNQPYESRWIAPERRRAIHDSVQDDRLLQAKVVQGKNASTIGWDVCGEYW